MAIERYVQSFDGTDLYVRVAGEGPAMVLCDGLGCDGFIWRHIRPKLEERFTVVRWHYRGHGRSKPPENMSALAVSDLRRDLLAVLDALDIGKATLFGHSMGVQVILDFAVEHPNRLAALVPMCGSFGRPLDTFHDNGLLSTIFPRLKNAVARWPDRAQWIWTNLLASEVAYQFTMHTEVEGSLLSRAAFKPYFDHMGSMDVKVFVRMLDLVRTHTVEDRLREISAPTLVIAGKRDTFTPVWLSRRMSRLIPNAELLIVPNGTHVAPLEQPELVELRLERFLSERLVAAKKPARQRKTARHALPQRSRRKRAVEG